MASKFSLLIGVPAALLVAGCDVEQTEQGELPDVDVSMEEGEMPDYEVDWADVDVGTTTETVTVPKVVVVSEEEEVEVPYIDVAMPDESRDEFGEAEERSVIVELEVAGTMHDVDIAQVFASEGRLYVVSRLEDTGEALEDQRVRVSDRIMLNAPDLDVQHIIVGDRPQGNWNEQYRFVASIGEAESRIGEDARQIYTARSGETSTRVSSSEQVSEPGQP